jgi:hypothetical protein
MVLSSPRLNASGLETISAVPKATFRPSFSIDLYNYHAKKSGMPDFYIFQSVILYFRKLIRAVDFTAGPIAVKKLS